MVNLIVEHSSVPHFLLPKIISNLAYFRGVILRILFLTSVGVSFIGYAVRFKEA